MFNIPENVMLSVYVHPILYFNVYMMSWRHSPCIRQDKQTIQIGFGIFDLCPSVANQDQEKMTQKFYETLPTYEELTVPELHLTWPEMKAGALYFGRFCDEPCKVCNGP